MILSGSHVTPHTCPTTFWPNRYNINSGEKYFNSNLNISTTEEVQTHTTSAYHIKKITISEGLANFRLRQEEESIKGIGKFFRLLFWFGLNRRDNS